MVGHDRCDVMQRRRASSAARRSAKRPEKRLVSGLPGPASQVRKRCAVQIGSPSDLDDLRASPRCTVRPPVRAGGFFFSWLIVSDKKTESVKVWLSERLLLDLARAASAEDRKISDYVGHVLSLHLYGHLRRREHEDEGAMRDD